MIEIINIFVLFSYLFQLSNLKIIYVFNENSIFNVTEKRMIKGTTLEIIENGEYIIKGQCENASITINSNYVTIYIINSNLNSGLNPLIMISENKSNIIINLNEAILSSSYDSGIIHIQKYSNLIINSKFSIIKGGKIIIGETKSELKIYGFIGLSDKINYIAINMKISENFIFQCENEKIKFEQIYMEIISNEIFKKREFCFYNSSSFRKNISDKSIYLYNKEINIIIKTPNLFKKIDNENNTFYLDYLYFKHINLAKEKNEEKILKKTDISFKPKVSVIIPIFNVEQYLIECLNSIINQLLKEIEIICVNDGSTDDSLLILLNYSKSDNRIMIIEQRNRGLSEARNTGVKYSNGEFIYFIDSDDFLAQNTLFELYEYSTKNNLDSIYFYFFKFKISHIQNIKKNDNITKKIII